MSVWSTRRKIGYLVGLILILALLAIGIYFFYFHEDPTCFDGIKNNAELSIDCGGNCQAVCESEVAEPVVLWSRTFRVSEGNYNAVAFVNNPNPFGVNNFDYKFRLENREGDFVTERIGSTFMNPDQKFMVFEPNIPVGERKPQRVTFKIDSMSPWHRQTAEEKKVVLPSFSIRNKKLELSGNVKKAIAEIENTSIVEAREVEVVAVVFDENNNAVAASRTVVENLPSGQRQRVVFTWPESFEGNAQFFELYPRIKRVEPER